MPALGSSRHSSSRNLVPAQQSARSSSMASSRSSRVRKIDSTRRTAGIAAGKHESFSIDGFQFLDEEGKNRTPLPFTAPRYSSQPATQGLSASAAIYRSRSRDKRKQPGPTHQGSSSQGHGSGAHSRSSSRAQQLPGSGSGSGRDSGRASPAGSQSARENDWDRMSYVSATKRSAVGSNTPSVHSGSVASDSDTVPGSPSFVSSASEDDSELDRRSDASSKTDSDHDPEESGDTGRGQEPKETDGRKAGAGSRKAVKRSTDVVTTPAVVEEQPVNLDEEATIVLTETVTFFLIDIPAESVAQDDQELAKLVRESNKRYAALKQSKESTEKYNDRGTQTLSNRSRTKDVQSADIARADGGIQAHSFDIFDSMSSAFGMSYALGLERVADGADRPLAEDAGLGQVDSQEDLDDDDDLAEEGDEAQEDEAADAETASVARDEDDAATFNDTASTMSASTVRRAGDPRKKSRKREPSADAALADGELPPKPLSHFSRLYEKLVVVERVVLQNVLVVQQLVFKDVFVKETDSQLLAEWSAWIASQESMASVSASAAGSAAPSQVHEAQRLLPVASSVSASASAAVAAVDRDAVQATAAGAGSSVAVSSPRASGFAAGSADSASAAASSPSHVRDPTISSEVSAFFAPSHDPASLFDESDSSDDETRDVLSIPKKPRRHLASPATAVSASSSGTAVASTEPAVGQSGGTAPATVPATVSGLLSPSHAHSAPVVGTDGAGFKSPLRRKKHDAGDGLHAEGGAAGAVGAAAGGTNDFKVFGPGQMEDPTLMSVLFRLETAPVFPSLFVATSVAFNPHSPDLLAVTYSRAADAGAPGRAAEPQSAASLFSPSLPSISSSCGGYIACWSLKNCSFPERLFSTDVIGPRIAPSDRPGALREQRSSPGHAPGVPQAPSTTAGAVTQETAAGNADSEDEDAAVNDGARPNASRPPAATDATGRAPAAAAGAGTVTALAPRDVAELSAGVTCLSWCPLHPHLLAVGHSDGAISVWDVRQRAPESALVVAATLSTGKHLDAVWEVQWRGERVVSLSSDGRLTEWNIKKGLEYTDLMRLKRISSTSHSIRKGAVKSDAFITRHAGGLCFDFSPLDNNIYIAGTEDGDIHKCSCSYSEQYLESFLSHVGPVFKVRYCPSDPNFFLSCSGDWSIFLWHHERPSGPVVTIRGFAQDSIVDVAWHPLLQTIFASVSSDGRLDIWDLEMSLIDPLASVILSHPVEGDTASPQLGRAAGAASNVFVKINTVAWAPSSSTVTALVIGDELGRVSVFKVRPSVLGLVEDSPDAASASAAAVAARDDAGRSVSLLDADHAESGDVLSAASRTGTMRLRVVRSRTLSEIVAKELAMSSAIAGTSGSH